MAGSLHKREGGVRGEGVPGSWLCCGPAGSDMRSSLWGWMEPTWRRSDSWCWQGFQPPEPGVKIKHLCHTEQPDGRQHSANGPKTGINDARCRPQSDARFAPLRSKSDHLDHSSSIKTSQQTADFRFDVCCGSNCFQRLWVSWRRALRGPTDQHQAAPCSRTLTSGASCRLTRQRPLSHQQLQTHRGTLTALRRGWFWIRASQKHKQLRTERTSQQTSNTPCLQALRHLHGLLGVLVQSGSLGLEDGHVGLQQVLPLHPLLPGHGAHQDGGVDVLEAHLHLVRGDDLCVGDTQRVWR